jgi:ATP-dependent Clp protease ATP-binding subunit ClpB
MIDRDGSVVRRFSDVTLEAPSGRAGDRDPARHRGRATSSTTACASARARSPAAVTLAKRYLSDRALPDTAVDLLDETVGAQARRGRRRARRGRPR